MDEDTVDHDAHILASPSCVHTFCSANQRESAITTVPKMTHASAGSRSRESHIVFRSRKPNDGGPWPSCELALA